MIKSKLPQLILAAYLASCFLLAGHFDHDDEYPTDCATDSECMALFGGDGDPMPIDYVLQDIIYIQPITMDN